MAVALVTGGSRGIGRAIAVQLARDGFSVAFCYKDSRDAASALESEIAELGQAVLGLRCDVSQPGPVKEMVKEIESKLGSLDVVVNNAGLVRDKPLVTLSDDEWNVVLRTNLDSVFFVCHEAVFGFMKRRKGTIINISSVAGVYGNPGQTNYCAAKAGIIGFSKALAKEVGSFGVRVNVVAPGYIETDMTKDLPQKVVNRVMPNIPLHRLGTAQDVADMVSFLASERARYITAQVMQVDGGLMI
jgi:3-oxoacyl-[acyl-carrier protein] reductase